MICCLALKLAREIIPTRIKSRVLSVVYIRHIRSGSFQIRDAAQHPPTMLALSKMTFLFLPNSALLCPPRFYTSRVTLLKVTSPNVSCPGNKIFRAILPRHLSDMTRYLSQNEKVWGVI